MLLTRIGIPRLWHDDPEDCWRVMRHFVPQATGWLARCHGYGLERMPPSGGAVLAVNHFAAIDPPLVGSFSRRAVHYMAKEELLSLPGVGEILRWTGAFPVRRGEADREALRQARRLVREGHVVGVFVEGTRQRLGHPGAVHPGGPMIAMQEDVPLVPCGLDSFGWTLRNRHPCAIVFGDPIRLDGFPRSGRGYREAAELVAAELARLWRAAAEAVATGFPERLDDGTRRSAPLRPGNALLAPDSLEPSARRIGHDE